MGESLAVPAKYPAKQRHSGGGAGFLPHPQKDEVQLAAARLLAQGFSRVQVAKALGRRLVPYSQLQDRRKLHEAAMRRLRSWTLNDEKFRDLIYEISVKELDLKTPLIFNGVARSAMRGRVDAARLALEVTGRHTPNHETVVTNVTVQVANIPRPE